MITFLRESVGALSGTRDVMVEGQDIAVTCYLFMLLVVDGLRKHQVLSSVVHICEEIVQSVLE